MGFTTKAPSWASTECAQLFHSRGVSGLEPGLWAQRARSSLWQQREVSRFGVCSGIQEKNLPSLPHHFLEISEKWSTTVTEQPDKATTLANHSLHITFCHYLQLQLQGAQTSFLPSSGISPRTCFQPQLTPAATLHTHEDMPSFHFHFKHYIRQWIFLHLQLSSKDNFFPFLFLSLGKEIPKTLQPHIKCFSPFKYRFCLNLAKLLLFLVTRTFLFRETLLEASLIPTQTVSCKFKFQWNLKNYSFWVFILICWHISLLFYTVFQIESTKNCLVFPVGSTLVLHSRVQSSDHFFKFVPIFQGTTRSGWPRRHFISPFGASA